MYRWKVDTLYRYWYNSLYLLNWTDFFTKQMSRFKEIKGNKKITELRAILQRESQNSYVYKQTKSVNNRKTVKTVMTLTWYSHFWRNGGLNQILKRQTSRFHYGSKVPAVTTAVFIRKWETWSNYNGRVRFTLRWRCCSFRRLTIDVIRSVVQL